MRTRIRIEDLPRAFLRRDGAADAATIRSLMRIHSRLAQAMLVIICSAMLHALCNPTHGQQRFDLADDDTWVLVQEADPATAEGQLAIGLRALADGDARRAESIANRWIDANRRHRLLPNAYLLRGDALMAQGKLYKALFDYEYIARMYPGSEIFITTLERELVIAKQFARGTRRHLWGLKIASAYNEAQELLIRIQERLPGSTLAEEAGIELADFYVRRGDMTLAVEAYELFIENYPYSDQLPRARGRLIATNLATYKGPKFDARGLLEARELLIELRRIDPVTAERLGAEAHLAGIDEREAAKLLETARYYLRTRDIIAAEFTIRRLVQRHPRTVATREALEIIPGIVSRLPDTVLRNAPDYDLLRQTLLGIDAPAGDPDESASIDSENAGWESSA